MDSSSISFLVGRQRAFNTACLAQVLHDFDIVLRCGSHQESGELSRGVHHFRVV